MTPHLLKITMIKIIKEACEITNHNITGFVSTDILKSFVCKVYITLAKIGSIRNRNITYTVLIDTRIIELV